MGETVSFHRPVLSGAVYVERSGSGSMALADFDARLATVGSPESTFFRAVITTSAYPVHHRRGRLVQLRVSRPGREVLGVRKLRLTAVEPSTKREK
jgi:hypothetical protein